MVWSDGNSLLELALTGFPDHHLARRFTHIERLLCCYGIKIARRPGGDDIADVGGIALLAQQVIRAGKRNKALGMFGSDEDAGRILDADGVVCRRVHDQQRLMQVGDVRHQAVFGDVVEEFAADLEWPARERDFDFAMPADVLDAILEQARHMGRIRRRGDRHDRFGFGNLAGCSENGGATETMADQDRWCFPYRAQMVGGPHQIGDVRGEGGVGQIAFTGAQAREVEPQHRDTPRSQCRRYAPGGQHVLATGETMREQGVSERLPLWQIQRCRELMAAFTLELETFGRHQLLHRFGSGLQPAAYTSLTGGGASPMHAWCRASSNR